MKEALKTALEALEYIRNFETDIASQTKYGNAAETIYEALAPTSTQCEVQDELCSSQEPVAFGMLRADGLILDVICPDEHESFAGEYTIPLYTTPPKEQRSCYKRPWVGLTATAKLDLLSTAKGVGGRINGDAQLLELLNEHETQLKRKNI